MMDAGLSISFEPLSLATLDAAARIASAAPDPWSRDALRRAIADENQLCRVALAEGVPVAFACYLVTPGSADLSMVAVDPAHRRKGIARALLAHTLPLLPPLGAGCCLLEVRSQNQAAIALYQKLGFEALARRPGMYQHPAEDGFLMALGLDNEKYRPETTR